MYAGGFTQDECSLFRWNGKKWTGINLLDNGLPDNIQMIDGIDSSFFVMVGDRGGRARVTTYDCGRWKSILPLKLRPTLYSVSVVSRNEIYVAGIDGILRYNGASWDWLLDSTNSRITDGISEFTPMSIKRTFDGNIYFTSQRNETAKPTRDYFWRWMSNHFAIRDSFDLAGQSIDAKFGSILFETAHHLYSANYGLFRLYDTYWEKLTPYLGAYISGTENNLFVSWDSLYHYNGNTWSEIFPRQLSTNGRTLMSDIRFAGSTLFVAMLPTTPSLVLRGRQKAPK